MSRANLSRMIRSMLALVVAIVTLAPLCRPLPAHAEGPSGNLTRNWSLESYQTSYSTYNGYDLRVASDWTRFGYSGNQPRFMRDDDYADCFSNMGAIERHVDGSHSQNIWYGHAFESGIYQTGIPATVGKAYGAKAWMFSAAGSSVSPKDGAVVKSVGIDPYGGSDASSSNIVWTDEPNGDDKSWANSVPTAAIARSSTVSLFLKVRGGEVYPDWNCAFLDAVVLAEAPTVSATSPAVSQPTSFTVSWNNVQLPQSGDVLYYDVQVRDGAGGAWTFWKKKKDGTSDVYPGQVGHTYYFRARAWVRYDSGGVEIHGAFSANGDTQTTVGQMVTGTVWNNTGLPIQGATVTVSGAGSFTTDGMGRYIVPAPGIGSHTLTAAFPGLTSPPAVPFTIDAGTGALTINCTLRPPGSNPVGNPDFEQALTTGWTASSSSGGAPAVQGVVLRSGAATLAVRQGGSAGGQSRVEQTVTLTAMYHVVLSFYAKTALGSGDRLVVGRYTTAPLAYTPLLTITGTADWTAYHVHLNEQDAFSGPIGIYFEAQQSSAATQAYLDEVVIGKSPGGPLDTFLPIVVKNSAQ